VPHVRPASLPLRAGALFAIGMLAMPSAVAQTVDPPDSLFMRPATEGDPLNPLNPLSPRDPRSLQNKRPRTPLEDTLSPLGQIPKYGVLPASGAGRSGFDSTNRGLPKAKAPLTPKQKAAAAAKAKAKARSDAAAAIAPPAPLPNSAAARLPQYQSRRGARSDIVDPATIDPSLLVTPPVRRRPPPEEDPFAPTGIQVGSFNLRPAIEVGGGYDTNPARVPVGKPSWFEVVAPELLVNSNWSRHELTAVLRGSYSAFQPASDLNRPSLDARIDGRIDVSRNTYLNFEGRYLISTDRPGSPNIQADLARPPIAQTFGATAGLGQRFNRLEVTAKATADRTIYQDSTFIDGETESNDDRNFNRYGADMRVAYELTPGVKPFLESGADTRLHDVNPDRYGVFRNSTGGYARAGTTFEISRILTGDIAVGLIARNYVDPTLPDISKPSVDASLLWLMSGLTTVKLTARTTVDETTIVGVSGVYTREAALQVDHAFRRWLIATARVAFAVDNYVGSNRLDDRYTISTALTYKLTREVALKAELRRDWRTSNAPGDEYTSYSALVGVRLQR
jgi:hypothetical protein